MPVTRIWARRGRTVLSLAGEWDVAAEAMHGGMERRRARVGYRRPDRASRSLRVPRHHRRRCRTASAGLRHAERINHQLWRRRWSTIPDVAGNEPVFARVIFESLADRYNFALASLEKLLGRTAAATSRAIANGLIPEGY